MKELPERIVHLEEKVLHVAMEDRPPTYFECRQKGHIKKRCSLHMSNDIVETGCCQDDDVGHTEKKNKT